MTFVTLSFVAVVVHLPFLLMRRRHGRPFGRLPAHLLGSVAGTAGLFTLVVVTALHAAYLESQGTGATVDPDGFVRSLGPCFVFGWFVGFLTLRHEPTRTGHEGDAVSSERTDTVAET